MTANPGVADATIFRRATTKVRIILLMAHLPSQDSLIPLPFHWTHDAREPSYVHPPKGELLTASCRRIDLLQLALVSTLRLTPLLLMLRSEGEAGVLTG